MIFFLYAFHAVNAELWRIGNYLRTVEVKKPVVISANQSTLRTSQHICAISLS